MQLEVKTLDAKKAGTVDLDDEIFGLEPRKDILHRCVRYQLAKRQAGTHATLGRSDVRGTQQKMFKQKGTGRARHGNKKCLSSEAVPKRSDRTHAATPMD